MQIRSLFNGDEFMEELNYTKLLTETLNATIKDQKKSNKRLYTILIGVIVTLLLTIMILASLLIHYQKQIEKYNNYREKSITKDELIELISSYHIESEE